LNLREALDLRVLERKELNKIKLDGSLFVITAGMMSEHTLAHELAVRMAPVERHSIHFVGYAAPDTPAGKLRAATRGEAFHFSESGGELTRHCEMNCFDLSAHADRDELVDFTVHLNPRTILLGHGEPEARDWMEQTLRARLPKLIIHQPAPGEALEV